MSLKKEIQEEENTNIITKINETQIEKRLKASAKMIFTEDNLGALTYKLQKLIPYPKTRVGVSEFDTIVNAARLDGMQELINLMIKDITE